jgi:hypothetical protein
MPGSSAWRAGNADAAAALSWTPVLFRGKVDERGLRDLPNRCVLRKHKCERPNALGDRARQSGQVPGETDKEPSDLAGGRAPPHGAAAASQNLGHGGGDGRSVLEFQFRRGPVEDGFR